MDKIIMRDYTRKVNKGMTFLIAFLLLSSIVLAVLRQMPALFAAAAADAAVMALLIYSWRKNKFEVLSSYVVCVMMSAMILLLVAGADNLFIMLLPVSLGALYLNRRLYLTVVGLLDVGFVLRHILQSAGENFIMNLFLVNLITSILFFMTLWGSDLIKLAASQGEKARGSLDELTRTFELIQSSTAQLNLDISACNSNLREVWDDSASMLKTVEEVSKGVMEQAESISEISQMMNEAEQKMVETQKNSSFLSGISSNASEVVATGSEKITQMGQQMSIISNTTSETLSTVQDLGEKMKEVVTFLSSISNIAEQTNMLALNAAIEAARAGESGKGFAVVADEVRKLAEQSANAVRQIDDIVEEVNQKTANVMNRVQKGKQATEEGEKIVVQVTDSFDNISQSFKQIDNSIADSLVIVDKTTSIFTKIRGEAEGIASISEEHSASTQEMLATMESQSMNIEKTAVAMSEITRSSERLQNITIKVD